AQFWDANTHMLIKSVELSYDTLFGASFSPDGTELACGAADNAIRLLSVPDGKLLLKFDNHSDWTFATCWTLPDAAQGQGLENAQPGTLTNRPPVHDKNQHLLSTGRDKAIKLIVADTGSFVDDINTFTSPYRCMARHPKANQVL